MNIKSVLKGIYYKFRNRHLHLLDVVLCGVNLKLLPGTVRVPEDQDDAWWFYLAKHYNVIYDIGCNVGYTALLALIQNPDRKMLLVDPNPKALQKATMNLIENDLINKVYFHKAFVSNKANESVKFYSIGAGAAGSMHASHAKTAASLNSFLEVKTVTLDYLYTYYNLKPDLVKIDVEGAETLVIESTKKLASETQCSFFIEMHDVENLGMKTAGEKMLDWCSEMNYAAWYLTTGEQMTSAELIENRGKCHLLLLPKGTAYPDYLKGLSSYSPLPKSI